jgi:hypothetical protein
MVSYAEAFPSKYTKHSDLPKPVVVTIKLAELEHIKGLNGEQQSKVVVYFARTLKPLILNRTNYEAIMDIAGTDQTDEWGGVKIELYATKVSMQGKMVDAVRVRAPGAQDKPLKAAVKDAGAKPEYEDEVPWSA